jgi:type I restriction enzyme S subunit
MIVERVKLGDIADFINGVAFKPADWAEDGKQIIRIQNLTDPSKPYNLTKRQVASKYEVMPGDLLVSWSATLGVFIWSGAETALVNQHIFRVVPDLNRVHPGYLRHMLEDALIEMESHLHGATMQHVNRGEFLATTIPLPPLAEQKRISAILDAADDLRTKRRESLSQLDALLQSTFLEMFGDPDELLTIAQLLDSRTLLLHKDGNHGSLYPRAEEFGAEGVPFISAKCVSDDGELLEREVQFLNESRARRLKIGWLNEGDVLLAHNASVGKTMLYQGNYPEALIGTSLTAFRPNPKILDSCFLLGALRSHRFQSALMSGMGQTTRNQVPITAQRRLSLPVPPLNEQLKFRDLSHEVSNTKKLYFSQLKELDTLFASLQSRAFRGEL